MADQENLIAARQKAATEAAARIREETERFVSDCVASLREQTAKLCDEMLDSIKTSETGVHQKTLNRLVQVHRSVQVHELRRRPGDGSSNLDQVRKELLSRTAEEYRDDVFARQRLVTGLNSLADEARKLAKQDATELVQRFGELGRRKFHLAA